ncbi:hypothetical protein [Bosea sp. (in: a-proteobacteria)]|uniref:hypothetical protein n=1 Tax=Bosea sp. (in: a-proteobacteria) TaxID=1871050 RepID=UPI002DDD4406|nr:hypothetical protein [Bosea sp. (in: a-proteobacteria)]HEV2508637.1 hypothetical protein [Bosea sp. (in: a-proteobacteria)]
MQTATRKRTAHINFAAEPELKDALQQEARRRSTSMSSVIRLCVIAQFAARRSDDRQAVV